MTMKKKKVAVVITARASYSRFKTALHAIKEHEGLELSLIVAASALLGRYGNALKIMEQDGFAIDARIYNAIEGGDLAGQVKTTGLGMIELSNAFVNLQPDMVVTIADRYETMATAIAASYMNIPLVHMQGGEVTGNIDEKVRHAITKLADLHLVATKAAADRISKMGEAPESIFVTGCPSLDLAVPVNNSNGKLPFEIYGKYGGVGSQPRLEKGYLVVMQHPVTTEYQQSRQHIEETLLAIRDLGIPALWFWPNIDAGSDGTSNGIRAFREIHKPANIHFFKNMEPVDFLYLLKSSTALVGNSSVGIRECSFMGVPVINIGPRQEGRERAENVVDVGYDREAIKQAITRQRQHGHYPSESTYGIGNAGKRIAEILHQTNPSSTKKIVY